MSRTRRQAQEQPEGSSDEGSFANFDDDDAVSMSDASDDYSGSDSDSSDSEFSQRRRKNAMTEEKDSDEEELERLVLGGKATFRDQLFRDDFLPDVTDSKALVVSGGDDTTGKEELDDSMLFAIDTAPAPKDEDAEEGSWLKSAATKPAGDPPAWEDSDDERLTVSLAGASRLRKLRNFEGEDVVNGTEYSERLRQQYQRLYPLPEWAKPAGDKKRRRRRSSTAGSDDSDAASGSDMDLDSDGEEVDPALPLDAFLRDANSFSAATAAGGAGSRKRRKLRPETLDIQRTRDIPDTHKSGVSSLAFHPRHPILLSTSVSSIMYLHHIDPAAHPTPNPALTSVQVKRTDLRRAAFVGSDGSEIVFAGRRRYFHSWNLSSGQVKKVSKIQGHQKEHRTMEKFRVSPDGRYMAIASSDKKGGGMLNIVNVATMQWIAQARIDGRGGIADFCWWSDGNGLTIAGKDGQVAEWSLTTKRTVGVWRDEGSIGGTVMALGGGLKSNGPAELGGDRWVAVGNNSGILNIYDRNELIVPVKKDGKKGQVEIKKLPTPTRTLEQLTTAISVVTFSPDGQLLAFGSVHKKDAMRLVHLPSCTVYRNWPTEQTPLGRITAVAFDANSEVLAVGNDAGKVRLWEIRG
ncbi:WD40-repeat-containing domain protein [Podospora australis]|uniref:WD40-repeat-containing domain protein n=1 Tax=Podospora australis TaxID=1536484 RepID=A0AAN7APX6_9PEZI|nr:WD40-repeat-containing domain protein [Podospora australis]